MLQRATFGAGCFWVCRQWVLLTTQGTDKFFRKEFPKLKSCYTGYLGGKKTNPTYEEVCTGTTGHAEVIQVEYQPDEINYRDLCFFFFRMHDPTTLNRQGNDRGGELPATLLTFKGLNTDLPFSTIPPNKK